MVRPMFGARPVAPLSVRIWVHSRFSEKYGSLDSRPFTSMLMKPSGLQKSLTFLLPPMLLRLLESLVVEPALPQEGQSRRCFVFPVLTSM